MADSVSMITQRDDITKRLVDLLDRTKSVRALFTRVIYPMYKNAQRERWQTEGASEGYAWLPLSVEYAKRKKIMFGGGVKFKWVGGRPNPWAPAGSWPSYPGTGTKMMIATGRLLSAVLGPGGGVTGGEKYHRMMATDTSLTVSINATESRSGKDPGSQYFKYANDSRKFMKFSNETIQQMRDVIKDYISSTRRTF